MRALLPYLLFYKRHKWTLMLGIILAIITLLASVSLHTLSGWFLSASAIAGISGLYSFNYMIPAAGVRSIAIIRIAGRYFERLVSHNATFHVLQHLRVFIFNRLVSFSPSTLGCFRYGEILNRVIADVDTLDHLYLRVISPLVSTLLVITIMTFWLSIFDIALAITLGSIMLLTLCLLPPLFYHAGKTDGENLARLQGEYRQQLTTWLQSQAELTLFSANQHYRTKMNNTEFNWLTIQRRQSELTGLSQALIMLIGGIAVIVTLWIASGNISDNQESSAQITLFVFCSLATFEALSPLTSAFHHLGQVIASANRITQLTKQPPEVRFTEKYTEVPMKVTLRLQNVTFSYKGQLRFALNDLTMDVLAGEHIAILGRTGCGKSTLLQLLTRTWDPRHGLISINTIPLADFSELSLRRTISAVTQRIHLFSATLRDNLLLAAPNVADAQLCSVLEQVGLQNLLEGEGLNSWLGEGGRQLSGGELHRLAITRALLHNGPLMLLDEPTEGLDTASENQIMNLLKQAMKDKTVLMVTHRLRGLINFDRIIEMDNGQIIKQSNYAEFLKNSILTTN